MPMLQPTEQNRHISIPSKYFIFRRLGMKCYIPVDIGQDAENDSREEHLDP